MLWMGLVRNVMLGRGGLHRAVLLDLVHSAGGDSPRSFLATGNITFSTAPSDIESVSEALEAGLQNLLGRHEAVVVRSMDWLAQLVAANPFDGYHHDDDWELEVCFLPHSIPKVLASRLGDTQRTTIVEVRDREVLTARPRHGPNRPHGNRLLERATGQKATARGWSTLQRIHAATVD
jgi:uncharacterized protein (DUF1697 family)